MAPCSLCNSKRWPTYSAAFDWFAGGFSIFFGFFDEAALFIFFVDFDIFFKIPFLTKFVFRSNMLNIKNCLR